VLVLVISVWGGSACAGPRAPDPELPPLDSVEQPSLAADREQPMAPPEVGPGARNPDDPFLLATIDADQHVVALFAGGVAERNPQMPLCAGALQRAQAAKIAIVEPPEPCLSVDLRVQGAGAAGVVFPEPPPDPTPAEKNDDEEGGWFDDVLSIFG